MNSRVAYMVLACALTAVLMAGCFSPSPQIAYYSLYAPGQRPVPEAAQPTALALSIGPVTLPDILRQAQIVTGGADGRYQLAEYHRWSGELERDFARAIAEQLSGSLGTERVGLFPWDQNIVPTCRVLIDVLSMGGELGKEATLAVRWSLVDPHGRRPPLVRRSDLRELPSGAGYPEWVAAQQRNVASLGREIAAALKTLPQ